MVLGIDQEMEENEEKSSSGEGVLRVLESLVWYLKGEKRLNGGRNAVVCLFVC